MLILLDVEAPTFSLDNRHTDDGQLCQPCAPPPPFSPQEDSWYSVLLEAESSPGP
jgi:hypothetical protein